MEVMASSSSIALTDRAKVPADGDALRSISHFLTALLQMSAHFSWPGRLSDVRLLEHPMGRASIAANLVTSRFL